MSRRLRKRKTGLRNRPGSTRRGPGVIERELRGLTTPSNQQPKFGTTIYESADKPSELKEDASLTVEVLQPSEISKPNGPEANEVFHLRQRGLPRWLAEKFYETTKRLMQDPELTAGGQKQLAQAANMIAKVDVETARFQLGEAAATQVQVNQVQTSPAELMKAYMNDVQDRINAAYPVPQIEDAEFSVVQPVQYSDQADEIAEAIKAEVPALKGMNGALTKIVKKVMDNQKIKENDNGSSSS